MDSAPRPSTTSPRFSLTWQPPSRLPCLRLRTCRATSHDRFAVGGSGALDSTHCFRTVRERADLATMSARPGIPDRRRPGAALLATTPRQAPAGIRALARLEL